MKRVFIKLIYFWGCIWYDKNYLKGKCFQKNRFSIGWKWIMRYWFSQKVLGHNKHVPFPAPKNVNYAVPKNIIFNLDDMSQIHSPNCYFQGIGAKITFGKNIKIAPNCGFITSNHDFYNLSVSAEGKDIKIGDNCWIGMNSVILPGVTLGDHTIVGAGSIVTKSFPDGNCVIAGNPAKLIKEIGKYEE